MKCHGKSSKLIRFCVVSQKFLDKEGVEMLTVETFGQRFYADSKQRPYDMMYLHIHMFDYITRAHGGGLKMAVSVCHHFTL